MHAFLKHFVFDQVHVLTSDAQFLFALSTSERVRSHVQEAWQELVDVGCSPVTVDQLQLCSMQGRKAGEYYDVVHSIPLHAVEQP